jgi:short-subunit dehydrogenase
MLAIITGASSGIGAVFARRLAAKGYNLLLVARREDRLRSLAEELNSFYHIQAEAFPADLTVDADRDRLAARILAAADLSLLVNNAGFGTMGYFYESEIGAQEKMHRLHILTVMSLTHAALANLVPRAQAGTGVINVSSVAAFGTSPRSVTYSASKTWINAFTQGLAMELGARNSPVKVQALCPGFTLSEFHDVMPTDRSAIPRSLWLTADFVVEQSLRGFERGQVFVVPHWRYKAIVAFMKITPEALMRRVSIAMARRYKKPSGAGPRSAV